MVPVTKLKSMELYDLYRSYKNSRKGKRRSADQVRFELNQFERLSRLCDQLNRHEYTPDSNYCFIHKREKSREVWASEVELKIIQAIIDSAIRPLIEKKLTNRTFNNRVGKGTHAAINQVIEDIAEASDGYANEAWIIKIDLKGYFPNINQRIAWELTEQLISESTYPDKDELWYLASIVNYVNPQFNSHRRSPIHRWNDEIPRYKSLFDKPFGTGAAIGFLYWQVMSNYYLNGIDQWIISNITPHYVRFVDDMVMVVRNKSALAMLPMLRAKLDKIGVSVHPKKFYCQHFAKGLEFLGYHIKPRAIHLNRKIVSRAFRPRHCGSEKLLCIINSYMGMIKCSTDDALRARLLDSVTRTDIEKDYAEFKLVRKTKRKTKQTKRKFVDTQKIK